MIAVDTNILVYAHRADSAHHTLALAALTACAQSPKPWGIAWPCVHEFFAVATHPRIYNPPTPPKKAIDQISAWLESPSLVLLGETQTHWPTLQKLLAEAKTVGPAVHDARIAALCLQHGVRELWSADRDFRRFPDLKVVNPLGTRTKKASAQSINVAVAEKIASRRTAKQFLDARAQSGSAQRALEILNKSGGDVAET